MHIAKKYIVYITLIVSLLVASFILFLIYNSNKDPFANVSRIYDMSGIEIPYGIGLEPNDGIALSGVILSSEVKEDRQGSYIVIYTKNEQNENVVINAYLNSSIVVLSLPDGQKQVTERWNKETVELLTDMLKENSQVIVRTLGDNNQEYNDLITNISNKKRGVLNGVSELTIIE